MSSIEETIKSLLDNIPAKDCVQYDPETGELRYLFDVHYRKWGKWWTFQIWAESDEHAAQCVDEIAGTMVLHQQVLARKSSA